MRNSWDPGGNPLKVRENMSSFLSGKSSPLKKELLEQNGKVGDPSLDGKDKT